MPAMGLMQAVNQVRMTNVAIVRYKSHGKRFEVACYKNKIVNWRNGVETDIKEVLQAETVFFNVSKGIIANSKDLEKCFGTIDQEKCCKIILAKGNFQVSDKEREFTSDNKYKDIATIISSKTVDSKTKRPYPVSSILLFMKEELHYAIKENKSSKQQALEVIKQLEKLIPIERAKMRLKLKFNGSEEDKIYTKLNEIEALIEEKTTEFTTFQVEPKYYRILSQFLKNDAAALEVIDLSVQNKISTSIDEVEVFASSQPLSTETTAKENEVEMKITEVENKVSNEKTLGLKHDNDYKKDKFKCMTCMIGFKDNRNDLKDHYKEDLHRVNLKLKMKNLEIMTKEVFEIMCEDEKNDIIYDFRK